ncbi:phenylalanine--tRNA ligase subunit beta [Patescibacteria group bacterium]
MKFSYNWIQSYFDKPLPNPEKLAELFIMHSFEVETKEKVGNDTILDLDILPNRAGDCSSHLGISREVAVLIDQKIVEPKFSLENIISEKTNDNLTLEVQEPDSCPRYMALLIKNVKVNSSPDWIKERLEAIGQKPINNIVDIANYVMLETGQPLHAFDLKKLGGQKIIVRLAEKGEKLTTLDDQNPVLDETVLLIADDKDPLAVAGIKGGKKAEITEETKDIVIESAVFDPISIRKASRKIGIVTDASYRFEHGVSMFLPEVAINRVANLIQEIAGGEVAEENIDICSKKPSLSSISFTKEDVEKLLGIKISEDEINKILNNLGFDVENKSGKFVVSPSKWRLDINIKEDLIEEIARIYGYENIKSEIPKESLLLGERNEEYFYSNLVKGILADMGLTEVYNYSFEKTGQVELKNPIASDKKYLRMNLLQGLRLNVAENFKNFDDVKLFEIGKVFDKNLGEKLHLAITIDNRKNKKENIQKIKGAVAELLNRLGIADVDEFNECIKSDVYVFECDMDRIIELTGDNLELPEIQNHEMANFEYKPFSKFPAIIRDVSLFVPKDIQIVEVMDIIENTAGEFLVDTDLFDEYSPPDEDKKSLAFRLIFQSFEKTLTDKEVNEIMEKIIGALEQNISWQVRKK